jgi:hypothetical protein
MMLRTGKHMSNVAVARMTNTDKVGEALRRSLPYLPEDAKRIVESMLTPASLAIIVGTLVVWAGAHFFGVGEIVDAILLAVGVVTLGFSVFEGASELYSFAKGALNAKSEKDLDEAGRHFARAVTILGISTIQTLLLKKPVTSAVKRGLPARQTRIKLDPPPPGSKLTTAYSNSVRSLGTTDAYGNITISLRQSLKEQQITLYHELVHRFFSPRLGPFRQFRAELRMSGYARSAFLKYTEEVLAEGYAQLRVNGLAQALGAIKFPIKNGYVIVTRRGNIRINTPIATQMKMEGVAIGSIFLGGELFQLSISFGSN